MSANCLTIFSIVIDLYILLLITELVKNMIKYYAKRYIIVFY
jgi:hypothetical protein